MEASMSGKKPLFIYNAIPIVTFFVVVLLFELVAIFIVGITEFEAEIRSLLLALLTGVCASWLSRYVRKVFIIHVENITYSSANYGNQYLLRAHHDGVEIGRAFWKRYATYPIVIPIIGYKDAFTVDFDYTQELQGITIAVQLRFYVQANKDAWYNKGNFDPKELLYCCANTGYDNVATRLEKEYLRALNASSAIQRIYDIHKDKPASVISDALQAALHEVEYEEHKKFSNITGMTVTITTQSKKFEATREY